MEIKPQAAVLPKDTGHLEQGKYGPIFPKTPACYGFTIIANVKPGRAETIRGYGFKLAKALESDPYLLAPLKLHYLRWCSSTTMTRSHSSRRAASTRCFENLEGFKHSLSEMLDQLQ